MSPYCNVIYSNLLQRNKRHEHWLINRSLEQGNDLGSCNGLSLDSSADSTLLEWGKEVTIKYKIQMFGTFKLFFIRLLIFIFMKIMKMNKKEIWKYSFAQLRIFILNCIVPVTFIMLSYCLQIFCDFNSIDQYRESEDKLYNNYSCFHF